MGRWDFPGSTRKSTERPRELHAMLPGTRPDAAQLAEMTRVYHAQIKASPMWALAVQTYGEARAEEMLKECQVEYR